jgi:DNA-binding NarL/FixJ family response regulator
VRDGLVSLLHLIEGFSVVAQAENGQELIKKIENSPCDIVLLDVDMPIMDGLEALMRLKEKYPKIKVLVLSMHDDKVLIQNVMHKGADGYMLKNSGIDELKNGLEAVMSGKQFFSTDVTMRLLDDKDRPKNVFSKELELLSEREMDVLKHIAAGLSNKEIGDKLFISHRTVDSHRTSIMKKLGVHNVAGLIRIALKHRLVI